MALSSALNNFWADPWEGMDLPSLLSDQHFGNVLPGNFFGPAGRNFGCPAACRASTATSLVVNGDQEFRIHTDVKHFRPDEIKITRKNDKIIINARPEERPDSHGYIMREFTRQYVLPEDVDPNTVKSSYDKGMLTLKAPKLALKDSEETVIPITLEKGDGN